MGEDGKLIAFITFLEAICVGGFFYCKQKKQSISQQLGEDCKNDKVYRDVNRGEKVSILLGVLVIVGVLVLNPFGPASEEEQEKIFIEWANGVMNEPYFYENNGKKLKDIIDMSSKNNKKTIKKLGNLLSELDEFDKKISKLKIPSRLSKERREVLSKLVDNIKQVIKVDETLCVHYIDVYKALDKHDTKKLEALNDELDIGKLVMLRNASEMEKWAALYKVGDDFGVVPEKDEKGDWFMMKENKSSDGKGKETASAATPKTTATNSKPATPPATSKPQPAPTNSDSTVSQYPATPEQILQAFHQNITNKDYRKAYLFLSKDFRDSAPYDDWEAGFRTTVNSTVSNVKVESQSGSQAVLTYTLKAVDNPGGTQYFQGTAIYVWTKAGWKIDDITNKPM